MIPVWHRLRCCARPLLFSLMVLSHLEKLLHNNLAGPGARPRVRKRDVSLHTRTIEGLKARDTFQALVNTATRQGVTLSPSCSDRAPQSGPAHRRTCPRASLSASSPGHIFSELHAPFLFVPSSPVTSRYTGSSEVLFFVPPIIEMILRLR